MSDPKARSPHPDCDCYFKDGNAGGHIAGCAVVVRAVSERHDGLCEIVSVAGFALDMLNHLQVVEGNPFNVKLSTRQAVATRRFLETALSALDRTATK